MIKEPFSPITPLIPGEMYRAPREALLCFSNTLLIAKCLSELMVRDRPIFGRFGRHRGKTPDLVAAQAATNWSGYALYEGSISYIPQNSCFLVLGIQRYTDTESVAEVLVGEQKGYVFIPSSALKTKIFQRVTK